MRKREGNKEKAIIDAAVKVFAEYGYHKAKIVDIAKDAGVATGSVYLYYQNKEGILLTIFDHLWTELTSKLREIVKRNDIDAAKKLNLIIDDFFSLFITNPSIATVFVKEQHKLIKDKRGNVAKHYSDFFDLAEEIIHEGIQNKTFNTNADIKILRYFIIGGLRNVLQEWGQQQAPPLDLIRQNVKRYIVNGLM